MCEVGARLEDTEVLSGNSLSQDTSGQHRSLPARHLPFLVKVSDVGSGVESGGNEEGA